MANEIIAANVKKVSDLLFANKEQFSRLLSKSVDAEKFLAVVVTCFQDNPSLANCTQSSMVRFALQCARMDMMPGPMRLCYPIPYKRDGKVDVQFQLGYKGAVELCWRSGQLAKIVARPVFEGDEFSYEYGLDETLTHKPKSEWWSKAWEDTKNQAKAWDHLTHVYAFAKLTNGERTFTVMTKAQCAWHRDRYSKAANDGPWVTHPIEMSLKTAVIENSNLLPASQTDNRLAVAAGWEKQAQGEVPQTLDVPFEIVGLDDEPQREAAPKQPEAHKLPNIGRHPERPVNDPSVSIEDLRWYLGVIEKNIGKQGREKFRETDEAHRNAIGAEILRRESEAGARKEPEKAPEPEPVKERMDKAMEDAKLPEVNQDASRESVEHAAAGMVDDAYWSKVVMYLDDGDKEKAKVLKKAKDIMKIQGHLAYLEPHVRSGFMKTFEDYAKKAKLEVTWPA